MLRTFTAKYTLLKKGYMGQIIEWPEVVTEGKTIEDCQESLRDALREMVAAYEHLGKEVPLGNCLIEQIPVETQDVRQTA